MWVPLGGAVVKWNIRRQQRMKTHILGTSSNTGMYVSSDTKATAAGIDMTGTIGMSASPNGLFVACCDFAGHLKIYAAGDWSQLAVSHVVAPPLKHLCWSPDR